MGETRTGQTGEVANLAARLEERAARHPERAALVQGVGRRRVARTYGALARGVAATGARLRGAGIGRGDRVLLFVPMSIGLYEVLLGVLHAGATAVFVDAWADRRRLEAAVEAAAPKAFVGTPKAHLLRLRSASIRRIPLHLWAGRTGLLRRPASGSPSTASPVEVDPDDPALVTFTTGSTGRPKAAARSHAFLWAQHQVLSRHLSLRDDDVDMPTLPVFVLNNLALGVTTVLPRLDPRRPADVDPEAILAQMRAEGVTTTSGSPAFYDRLAGHARIPVRALFTGGAPVFPPLAARLVERTEGEVTVLYGSTEAEPIAGIPANELVAAAKESGAEGVCAGPPVPEIDWRIIRPVDGALALASGGAGGTGRADEAERSAGSLDELEVASGEPGELIVSGAHVLRGYLDDPEAEAMNKIRDGDRVWHRTGDGARFDGRRLWLMGRVSQRVQRDGRTWWPMAAEARAVSVPGVAHAAYLSVPGPDGQALTILCVEGPGPDIPESALREALDPCPVDRVLVLDRIPRDPRHASKTDLEALVRWVRQQPGGDAE